jgi:hypothetical protein
VGDATTGQALFVLGLGAGLFVVAYWLLRDDDRLRDKGEPLMDTCELWERFNRAMYVLFRKGDLRERLAEMYEAHLSQLDPDNLPEEMRAGFLAVRETLNRVHDASGAGNALASARALGDQEARELSLRIIRLYAAATQLAAGDEIGRERWADARRPSLN